MELFLKASISRLANGKACCLDAWCREMYSASEFVHISHIKRDISGLGLSLPADASE
jgi:hypothetical protein